MELVLIRHAIPVRRQLITGVADPELSDTGLRQAKLLAQYLASEDFDALYASPLQRAQQTAEPLSEELSLPVITVDGVAEYDRNSNEYIPVEELKASNDPRWQEMLKGIWPVGDESEDQFMKRIFETVEGIIEQHHSQKVAIVCHGGVINGYIGRILGLQNPRGFFYPNYTSINRIAAATSGERSVVNLNETSHLRGTGLPMGLFQTNKPNQ